MLSALIKEQMITSNRGGEGRRRRRRRQGEKEGERAKQLSSN
jgi:hypothetical protein